MKSSQINPIEQLAADHNKRVLQNPMLLRERILTIKLLGNYNECENFIEMCLIKHRAAESDDTDAIVDIDGFKMQLVSCELPRDKNFHYYFYDPNDYNSIIVKNDEYYDAIIYVKPSYKPTDVGIDLDDWKEKYKKNWEINSDALEFTNHITCRKLACVAIEYDPAVSAHPWECLSEIPDLIIKHIEIMKKITLLEAAKQNGHSILSSHKIPKEITSLIQFSLFNLSTQIHQRAQNALLEKTKKLIDSNCKMM